MRKRPKSAALREFLFRTSVLLKGLDALFEIAGGIALWLINPSFILRLTALLTQDEIGEDPHDLVANYLRHAAAHLSVSGEHFMAIYLFSHGVIKMFAVVALLKNKLWGYPLSIVVFGGFIVYQMYSIYSVRWYWSDSTDLLPVNRPRLSIHSIQVLD